MAEPDETLQPATAGRNTAVLRALSIPIGLAATWFWVGFAPANVERFIFDNDTQAVATFYLLLFGPLLVVAGVLGLICRTRPFRIGEAPAKWLAIGLLAGGGGLAIAVGYAWLNGGVQPGMGPTMSMQMLALGIVLTLVQTSAEEFLVRGWLQPVVIGLTGPVAGILLSSLMFAGLHLASGPVAWHSLANMVLAGALFGVLAWRSGGLVAPCAAHFAWNAFEDLGFGLVPNPGVGPFGALSDIEIVGPALWGGGGEGLNQSIGTTIVLVALILPLLYRNRMAPAGAAA